ncbi:MAG: RagB/SusD family nutrient uptake outer membrane protein [Flavobacteriaceae bacterium]|nr:RagB/SusD family nutrient uptake outer membrane protein [Flavobacteriaceae bacterium]
MKKYIYTYIICIVSLYSCSLDLDINDEITGLDAIDGVKIAKENLASIYLSYPKNRLFFSQISDDFLPNTDIKDSQYSYNLYKWEANSLALISDSLWIEYYRTIAKANLLLEAIENIFLIDSKEIEDLNNIKAQALCLKALCEMDLMEIYSSQESNLGIILKNSSKMESLARATVEQSYDDIEILLYKAIGLFSGSEIKNESFNINSARFLLAKNYLNYGEYEKCNQVCESLISENVLTDNFDDYKNSWIVPLDNKEVILFVENESYYFNDIYDSSSQKYEYDLNTDIVFTTDDYRKQVSVLYEDITQVGGAIETIAFIGKYRTNITDQTPRDILLIRTAELYYIYAESLIKSSKRQEAIEVLNSILSVRNASIYEEWQGDFLEFLLTEKQKEFVGESQRYFDLKRNNKSIQKASYNNSDIRRTIYQDDFRWLLPIPKVEIQQNANAKQNPEWESII